AGTLRRRTRARSSPRRPPPKPRPRRDSTWPRPNRSRTSRRQPRSILASDAPADRPSRGSRARSPGRAPAADLARPRAGARAGRAAARARPRPRRRAHEPAAARPGDRAGARLRRAGGGRAARPRRDTGRRARRRPRPRRAGLSALRLRPGRARAGGRTVSAISVRGLHKSYGTLEAVRGVDFEIAEGEVFGLLGPNGAGKTTTVEILEGYRSRDAGEVRVLGHDPQRPGPDFRERIGVVLQQSELWPNLTVRETHAIFAGYYRRSRDVDEVIELVGLADKADARVKSLSGGQKRRLDLGVALVGDPELVFLDEPTTGFDPAARRAAWEMIRSLRSLGKTVLLTTHYLDEAEQLADRVAVLRDGVIVRIGTPRELTTADLEVEIRYRRDGEDVLVRTTDPTRRLHELTSAALEDGVTLDELEVRRPSLEDVYLELTAE